MRLAPAKGVKWACALVASLAMGCLVTEKGDFPVEENVPPTVESQPGAEFPLGRVHVFDLTVDDGTIPNIPLEVVVTDLNVDQTLRAVVLVDNDRETIRGRLDSIPPAPDDSITRDDVVVEFDESELMVPGCHRVELRVSSQFGFFSPDPADPEDLGTAVWWFFTKDESNRSFDPSLCPAPSS